MGSPGELMYMHCQSKAHASLDHETRVVVAGALHDAKQLIDLIGRNGAKMMREHTYVCNADAGLMPAILKNAAMGV